MKTSKSLTLLALNLSFCTTAELLADNGFKQSSTPTAKQSSLKSDKHRKNRKKCITYDADKWENGISWHPDIPNLESPWTVIARQDILISNTPPVNTTSGILNLAAGQTISASVIPTTNVPAAGVDSQIARLVTTGASITSNVVTYTLATNPITEGFVNGLTIVVDGFSSEDNAFNGAFIITNVTATSISANLPLPSPNQTATSNGLLVASLTTGNYFTEELWLTYPDEDWNDRPDTNGYLPIASAVAGGSSLVLRQLPNLVQDGFFNNYSPGTSPNAYVLRRVRLTTMPYGTWAGMMDNNGNVIIKSKYAVNRNKTTSLYLIMAEQQDDGSWEKFEPVTDGKNLRFVDQHQVATWKVSNLKAGHKYSAIAIHPTIGLINMINRGEPTDSQFFQGEMRRSVTSTFNTVFRMPYTARDCRDIKIGAASCNFDGNNALMYLAAERDYDMFLHLGDHAYVDGGGASSLSFNLPNNAGTALGFTNLGAALLWQAFNTQTPTVSPNALLPNTVINSTNNLFILNGVRYVIPSGEYATANDLAAAFATLIGPDFSVTLNESNQLVINQPLWSDWSYNDIYTQTLRSIAYTKFQSTVGSYNAADDHEVYNNFPTITTIPIKQQGTPLEVEISRALNTNQTAVFYRINYAPLQLAPAPAVPVANANIDTALENYDRYIPAKFATTGERFGFVRWGQVELIQLDSLPLRNTQGEYEYYQEQGKFMRDDQLQFLLDRLRNSDAKVKIVMYSRHISASFLSLEEIQQQKELYVSIAVSLGFGAADAATTFDKVFGVFQANFVTGYIPWYTETFLPVIEATGAKNVYFVSGGNHYMTLDRLVSGSKFTEVGTSSISTPSSGNTSDGTKNGQPNDSIVFAYDKNHGISEITVSPKNKTVQISFLNVDNEENSVTFPIEEV